MTSDRRALRRRTRRIIFNDDGDTRQERHPGSQTCDAFLAARFERTLDTHVDTYVFCVGNGMDNPFGRPKDCPAGDPEALTVEAAHANGMEVFASLRMNDIHESLSSLFGGLVTPLKKEHPEYCIGEAKEYPTNSIMRFGWSAFDYARPEVRDYFLDFIARIVGRYDWDGFEMDFCRHPIFFKPEGVREGIPIMTEFVGKVRETLDAIGRERGRPLLLAAHVTDSPGACLRAGMDVTEWVNRDYLDVLIPGIGYSPTTSDHAAFVTLGHGRDVPVYPCINASILSAGNIADHSFAERMRAAAADIWADNADGVYLFNLFCLCDNPIWAADSDRLTWLPVDKVWGMIRELGDPETLADLDRIHVVQESRAFAHMLAAGAAPYLPRSIVENWSVPLRVEEDLSGLQAKLRVRLTEIGDDERIIPRINGIPIDIIDTSPGPERRPGSLGVAGGRWFEAVVSSPPLARGVNHVEVLPGNGCVGNYETLVHNVELHATTPAKA